MGEFGDSVDNIGAGDWEEKWSNEARAAKALEALRIKDKHINGCYT